MSLDLTIAIPVKNEEKNLALCLEAIGKNFSKNIVVIDSGSTDETIKIAKEFGADIIEFDWNGKFPKKRNWFLRNYQITTKWVLFLDADEYVTEKFKSELREKLDKADKVGYWLTYTNHFLGKELRGGYPLRKLALFQPGAGEYEFIDEEHWSHLDMEVHEHPILKGPVGLIKSKVNHNDFRDISHYISKHIEYAKWESFRMIKAKSEEGIAEKWTWKQRLKYRLMRTALIGPIYFFGSFFVLGGFRDGARGLAFAIFKMSYFTQVYCNIKSQTSRKKSIDKKPLLQKTL